MKTPSGRTIALALAASFTAAAAWTLLAWRTPTSTFHFAPLVAAGVGPYIAKSQSGRLSLRGTSSVVGLCTAVVALATATLAVGDRLQGPTFWSDSGALGEVMLFIVLGSAIGFALLVDAPTKPVSDTKPR